MWLKIFFLNFWTAFCQRIVIAGQTSHASRSLESPHSQNFTRDCTRTHSAAASVYHTRSARARHWFVYTHTRTRAASSTLRLRTLNSCIVKTMKLDCLKFRCNVWSIVMSNISIFFKVLRKLFEILAKAFIFHVELWTSHKNAC